MIDRFMPVGTQAGTFFDIQELQTVAAPAAGLITGAVLIFTAGLVDLAGADPTPIVGVAMQPGDSNPGFQAANNPAVSTGRKQTISVAVANSKTIFGSKFTNGSSTLIAPAVTDLGVSYGITAYSNIWTVDKAKVSGGGLHRVRIIDVDTTLNLVFFHFLATHFAISS